MWENCGNCKHRRDIKHFKIMDERTPVCNLTGKEIEWDKNDFPVNCLLKYVKGSE